MIKMQAVNPTLGPNTAEVKQWEIIEDLPIVGEAARWGSRAWRIIDRLSDVHSSTEARAALVGAMNAVAEDVSLVPIGQSVAQPANADLATQTISINTRQPSENGYFTFTVPFDQPVTFEFSGSAHGALLTARAVGFRVIHAEDRNGSIAKVQDAEKIVTGSRGISPDTNPLTGSPLTLNLRAGQYALIAGVSGGSHSNVYVKVSFQVPQERQVTQEEFDHNFGQIGIPLAVGGLVLTGLFRSRSGNGDNRRLQQV